MLIAYRDYVQDATVTVQAGQTWDDLENLKTRQLGYPATTAALNASFTRLHVDFGEEKTVGIVSLLGHNFREGVVNAITIILRDGANVLVDRIDVVFNQPPSPGVVPLWLPPADSLFPKHFYYVYPETFDNVRYMTVEIAYEGSGATGNTIQVGRLWAGPFWQPAETTSRRDFSMKPKDVSVLDKSPGQQAYADRFQCFRLLTCRLNYLTEEEAIGDEDDVSVDNLLDVSFEVGRTDPVIVIPTQKNNHVIHRFGIYGHFVEPPPVNLVEEAQNHKYWSLFDVEEDL